MNVKNFMRRARRFMPAALLLPGLVLLSGATAQARGRWHGGRTVVIAPRFRVAPYGRGWYGYRYGYSEFVFANSAAAESQGYHDGLQTGSEDASKRKSFDPERSHFYTDAGFGNFAEAYRQGFMNGYNAGFRS